MKLTQTLFLMNFFSGNAYSMLSPLFPSLAVKKGLTETIVGLIIGIFDLSNIIITCFTPILSVKFTRIKLLYIATFLEATSTFSYGIIGYYVNSYYLLIILIFIARIVHGMCSGIIGTLLYSLAISLAEKESEKEKTLGELEIGWCIGLATGPIIASIFYKLGGYPLPFIVLGILLYTSVYLSSKVAHEKTESNEKTEENPRILKFLIHGEILVILGSFFFGMISESFFYPSLTNHLTTYFHISLSFSTLFFMILAIVYIFVLSNIDKVSSKLGLYGSSYIGLVLASLGVLMVYPYPPLPKSLIIVALGLGVIGGGGAPIFIPGLVNLSKNVNKIDPSLDNYSANDVSSAINNITIAIGDFCGPVLGGFFSTHLGFKHSCLIISGITFLYSFLYLLYFRKHIFLSEQIINKESKSDEMELINHPGFYKDDNLDNMESNIDNLGTKGISIIKEEKEEQEDDDPKYLEFTDK